MITQRSKDLLANRLGGEVVQRFRSRAAVRTTVSNLPAAGYTEDSPALVWRGVERQTATAARVPPADLFERLRERRSEIASSAEADAHTAEPTLNPFALRLGHPAPPRRPSIQRELMTPKPVSHPPLKRTAVERRAPSEQVAPARQPGAVTDGAIELTDTAVQIESPNEEAYGAEGLLARQDRPLGVAPWNETENTEQSASLSVSLPGSLRSEVIRRWPSELAESQMPEPTAVRGSTHRDVLPSALKQTAASAMNSTVARRMQAHVQDIPAMHPSQASQRSNVSRAEAAESPSVRRKVEPLGETAWSGTSAPAEAVELNGNQAEQSLATSQPTLSAPAMDAVPQTLVHKLAQADAPLQANAPRALEPDQPRPGALTNIAARPMSPRITDGPGPASNLSQTALPTMNRTKLADKSATPVNSASAHGSAATALALSMHSSVQRSATASGIYTSGSETNLKRPVAHRITASTPDARRAMHVTTHLRSPAVRRSIASNTPQSDLTIQTAKPADSQTERGATSNEPATPSRLDYQTTTEIADLPERSDSNSAQHERGEEAWATSVHGERVKVFASTRSVGSPMQTDRTHSAADARQPASAIDADQRMPQADESGLSAVMHSSDIRSPANKVTRSLETEPMSGVLMRSPAIQTSFNGLMRIADSPATHAREKTAELRKHASNDPYGTAGIESHLSTVLDPGSESASLANQTRVSSDSLQVPSATAEWTTARHIQRTFSDHAAPAVTVASPSFERLMAISVRSKRDPDAELRDSVQPSLDPEAETVEAPDATNRGIQQASAGAPSGALPKPAAGMDIDSMARQVFEILQRRLRVEHERSRGWNR